MLQRFARGFVLGVRSFIQAFFFIVEHNLWLYFLIPIGLFLGMYAVADYVHASLLNYDYKAQLEAIDFQRELRNWSWFNGFPSEAKEMDLIIRASQMIYVVAVLRMKRYLILILMSPLLAFISSRIEFVLVENLYKWDTKQFIKDIYRGINFAFRNMIRQAFILGVWYSLVSVITDLDQLSLFVSFLVGAYYYGASLMDYTNERRRMTMEESVTYIRKNIGITMGVGLIFYGLFFIEFVGFIVAPIAGVVAATLAIHKKEDLANNDHAVKGEVKKEPVVATAEKYKDDPWLNG